RVQPGDKFQAVIGCEPEATGCYVRFRLDYRIGAGDLKNFWAFYEKLDGQYYRASVDLTPLAGQDVRFILTVHTAGLATGDRAIWGNPVILRGGSGGTVTPSPTPTVTRTPTPTITPGGPTLTPSATLPPAASCDRAAFVSDVTVPDGTTFTAGSNFTKIWRLKNVGTCTWTSDYRVVFANGDAMSAATVVSLPRVVKPGETVDVSIKMIAPNAPGTYRGEWKLRNAAGGLFGIGSTADKAFWVEIKVAGVPAGGAYDFFANACQAEWRSGAGVLPCPGADGDSRGFVLRQDKPALENGTLSADPGLLTAPQNIFNGYIQGTFPAFRVQAGDRFQSIVNCESGAVNCYARFRLDYQVGSEPVKTFWSFLERYEGQYYRADVDLTPLAGKDVKFILFVSSAGFASGDRALWVAPRIYRAGGGVTQTPPPVVLSPTASATATATRTPTVTATPGAATFTPTATSTLIPSATPTATPTTPSATPLPDVSLWAAYLNSTYGFTFKIPPASSVTAASNESARIFIPLLTPGTNLVEKYADVNVVPSASTCVNPNPGADPAQDQSVTINGIPFLKQTGSGVAAGSLYEWVGYSTLRNGNCISVTFVLHSSNPGNYPTPPPLFDKAAESAIFNTIINTFAFWP
ncbi:MAG: NBR1-Ig-like domain-containing protein, partial [Anaerolineales bacterium]